MATLNKGLWLGLALAALLSASCAGILMEKEYDNGSQERLRLGTDEKWSKWDRNPIKEDGRSIILKKESTF